MVRWLLPVLASCALIALSCESTPQAAGCPAGREGCACSGENACFEGLQCVAGVCRRYASDGQPPPAGFGGGGGQGGAVEDRVPPAPDGGSRTDAAGMPDASGGGSQSGSGGGGVGGGFSGSGGQDGGGTPADAGSDAIDCPTPRPVVFVHGINGSSENFAVMMERMAADGWPQDFLVGFDAADPTLGCNVDNAAAIKELVDSVRERTGFDRVDLIAHSMGTLSSRYYIKNLGGTEFVNTYVTLGGMHHGLDSPCWSPVGMQCTWDELCGTREFLTQLNADPATPGRLHWVSIYGTADTTVPNASSYLEGAENIELPGVTHSGTDGLEQSPLAYAEIVRVLQYPCW